MDRLNRIERRGVRLVGPVQQIALVDHESIAAVGRCTRPTVLSIRGFGFVADESGREYFFHQSACQSFDSLREGQPVTFQTGQDPKGPRAENVRESKAHRHTVHNSYNPPAESLLP